MSSLSIIRAACPAIARLFLELSLYQGVSEEDRKDHTLRWMEYIGDWTNMRGSMAMKLCFGIWPHVGK